MNSVPPAGTRGQQPAFLPLRQAGGGGGSAFSEQVRAQITQQLHARPARAADRTGVSEAAGLRQFQSVSAAVANDPQGWATVARSIGGNYLPPQIADLFSRQMALESGNFS